MLISILPEGGCLTNIFVSMFSALSEVGGERFIPSLIYTHRFAEYFSFSCHASVLRFSKQLDFPLEQLLRSTENFYSGFYVIFLPILYK